MNLLLFAITVYLAMMANYIWQMWVLPACKREEMHCIQPMFSQSELEYADLYVFVTDMNLERRSFHRKYYNGLPPADLARAAWSVYQDHVLKRIGEQQRRARDEAASGASISSRGE